MPHASASAATRPKPSCSEGRTKRAASRIASGTEATSRAHLDAVAERAGRSGADEAKPCLGQAPADQREGAEQQAGVLARIVAAADEDDRRALEPCLPLGIGRRSEGLRVDRDRKDADAVGCQSGGSGYGGARRRRGRAEDRRPPEHLALEPAQQRCVCAQGEPPRAGKARSTRAPFLVEARPHPAAERPSAAHRGVAVRRRRGADPDRPFRREHAREPAAADELVQGLEPVGHRLRSRARRERAARGRSGQPRLGDVEERRLVAELDARRARRPPSVHVRRRRSAGPARSPRAQARARR